MAFVPEPSEWMPHLDDIPKQTLKFCNDLSNLKILDVGCGDMLADFGLLVRDPQQSPAWIFGGMI
jgi:hypothetical protein